MKTWLIILIIVAVVIVILVILGIIGSMSNKSTGYCYVVDGVMSTCELSNQKNCDSKKGKFFGTMNQCLNNDKKLFSGYCYVQTDNSKSCDSATTQECDKKSGVYFNKLDDCLKQMNDKGICYDGKECSPSTKQGCTGTNMYFDNMYNCTAYMNNHKDTWRANMADI